MKSISEAKTYAENKDRPLIEIWAEFDASHKDILALLDGLDEETFAGKLPGEWAGDAPQVWIMIGGNTCWHYPEHSEAIEAWIEKTGAE